MNVDSHRDDEAANEDRGIGFGGTGVKILADLAFLIQGIGFGWADAELRTQIDDHVRGPADRDALRDAPVAGFHRVPSGCGFPALGGRGRTQRFDTEIKRKLGARLARHSFARAIHRSHGLPFCDWPIRYNWPINTVNSVFLRHKPRDCSACSTPIESSSLYKQALSC